MFNKIYSKAAEYENEIVRFLSDLVSVPSFSGKEKQVVEVINDEMKKLNFDEIKIDNLGNIIGRIGNGQSIIAFDAHIDTVYSGDLTQWNTDPFTPVIKNKKIFGRGTADQKSGLASMIYAGKIIKELELNNKYSILFTGTVMEEDCDGLCWQYIIKENKIKPELVIITEPTNMGIFIGQRGRMEIKIKISGKSSHGSAPERGDNAVYKISKIINEIEKLNPVLPSDDFLGKGTVTVTFVSSSSPSLCAVPDGAEIILDRRLTYGETADTVLNEIKSCVEFAGYPEAEIEVLKYNQPAYTELVYPSDKYFPTWKLDLTSVKNSEYLKKAVSTYKNIFNKEPIIDKWTFSTNGVAIAGMFGIPCIGFGPGNEIFAHAPNEYCDVSQLKDAAAFYAAFVYNLNLPGFN